MLLYSILFSQKLHLWYPGDVSSHAFCGASSSCNWLVGRFSQTLQPQIHPSIHPSIKFLLNIFHLFFVVSLAYLNLLVSLKLLKGQQHLSSLHVFRSSWCLVCSVQSNCQPRTWDACFTNYRLWSTCSYCCASRLSTSLSVLVRSSHLSSYETVDADNKSLPSFWEKQFLFETKIVLEEKCTQYFSSWKKTLYCHFHTSLNHRTISNRAEVIRNVSVVVNQQSFCKDEVSQRFLSRLEWCCVQVKTAIISNSNYNFQH